ncbi:hypothetical protein IMCC3135_23185 [Granulosicoccus antarcticus IMCC3135]|uniref:Uncharacterized protein n=1 Tax=Granulosicoccus antarcticus IMCC3135 TaxID=1192854 RepID=A0A2Z2NT79_9GAMM|nr:hypothetical protein IMCC3135_23185 [Granulosicoccus antarcticus IMCC3135]
MNTWQARKKSRKSLITDDLNLERLADEYQPGAPDYGSSTPGPYRSAVQLLLASLDTAQLITAARNRAKHLLIRSNGLTAKRSSDRPAFDLQAFVRCLITSVIEFFQASCVHTAAQINRGASVHGSSGVTRAPSAITSMMKFRS